MKDGDVLVLENTRFHEGEEKNDPALHRRRWPSSATSTSTTPSPRPTAPTASTEGLAQAAARLCRPRHAGRDRGAGGRARHTRSGRWSPSSAAPRSRRKIDVLDHLVEKVDALVIGGGMANTFLLAKGIAIGKSLAEPDLADTARNDHRGRRQGRLRHRPAGRRGRRGRVEGRRRRPRPSRSMRCPPTR